MRPNLLRCALTALVAFIAFSPTQVFALCCKCYKGGPSIQNSFCVNGTTALANCTGFEESADAFTSLRSSDPELLNNVSCNGVSLSAEACEPISSGGSSAQCQSVAPLTAAGIRTALQGIASRSTEAGSEDPSVSDSTPFESLTPRLGVQIPGLTLSEATKNEDAVNVPFLAEYINGVYRYLIGIVLIVAIVMLVYGGFRYLIGSAIDDVSKGKAIIRDALIGMLLVIGAYTILNTVNPDLTVFKSLTLTHVKEEILEQPGGIEYGVRQESGTRQGSSFTGYDAIFQRYAGCARLDWRVLKAVAFKESGFNATVVNRYGFIGLFQTKPQFCSLARYGRANDCQNLQDPDNNTASAAGGILRSGTNLLTERCPNIQDPQKFVMLLYFGHNSGPGALRSVLGRVGCNGSNEDYDAAATAFWVSWAETRNRPNIPGYDRRMQFARTVADTAVGYGVTNPIVSGQCPLTP